MTDGRGDAPAGRTVADLGERGLIDLVRALAPDAPPWLLIGIGDDAAVLEPERGTVEVLTTDALVEAVHFDRRFGSIGDVGYKALAVNLSDIAAMGARPRAALLSLVVPADMLADEARDLVAGLLDAAARFRVALAGGNIARSPGPLVVDVTVTGTVHRRKVLTRSGARPGDDLYVSGSFGGSAAALEWLQAGHGPDAPVPDAAMAAALDRFRRPEPRLRLGSLLSSNRTASACMDLSDGLADAVHQVAAASGVGACLEADALPVDPAARAWFGRGGDDPLERTLAGGEDYELLFTVPRRRRGSLRTVARQTGGLALTKIGVMTADPAVVLRRETGEEALPGGFAHF